MVGPLLLIPSLRVESNVLSFFKEGSRVRKDYDFISQHLTGLSTIEADFRGSPQDCLRYIHSFNEKLLRIQGIRPVVYMSRGSFRMSIFVETMESMDFNKLVDDIRAVMAGIDGGGVKVRLTGTVLLLNSIQEELVRTQIKSFGTALLTIILVFVLVFRSAKVVLIGTAVNLLPITVLAGVAALSNIPLNVATIMIAGVAIGIAVDDTVFFLVRLREEPGGKESADAAIDSTLRHLTAPMTYTTLVITLGFFALIPSEFRPIQYFGILGGLTMISAWLGDVVLLPALLYAFHPRRGRELYVSS
jgi:predicted RND superfamily exporter protein